MKKLLLSVGLIGALSSSLHAMMEEDHCTNARVPKQSVPSKLNTPQSSDLVAAIKKNKSKVLARKSFKLESKQKTWKISLVSIPVDDDQSMMDINPIINNSRSTISYYDYFDRVFSLNGLCIIYDRASPSNNELAPVKAQVVKKGFNIPLITFLVQQKPSF